MDATSIARIAGLIGEAGRIQMLTTMLDGRGHSASELAIAAGVSPQTASSHLSKLLTGGLVESERLGRQRVYRLKNTDVATAIEAIGALAADKHPSEMPEVRFARTCYDHLAGVLAIAVRDGLLKRGALRHQKDAFALTADGKKFLASMEIDYALLAKLRRSFAHKCLDWTERRHHVGGALGAALLARWLEIKWLVRLRETRAVRITHEGEKGFERILGVRCAELRARR